MIGQLATLGARKKRDSSFVAKGEDGILSPSLTLSRSRSLPSYVSQPLSLSYLFLSQILITDSKALVADIGVDSRGLTEEQA